MILTTGQQIILHCLFIAPEDPRGFEKYQANGRSRRHREKYPERAAENAARYREIHPEYQEREYQRRKEDPEYLEKQNQLRRGNPGHRAAENFRRNLLRRKLDLLKMDRPCYDCGGVFSPSCMDWDHLPGKEKKFNIGPEACSRSLESVINEINKCQLVCATCHRKRTELRKQKECKVLIWR